MRRVLILLLALLLLSACAVREVRVYGGEELI